MAKNDFQYGGWNYYTLQCGMWLWDDMPWNSPERSPYWNSTSGFDFDHIIAVNITLPTSTNHQLNTGATQICHQSFLILQSWLETLTAIIQTGDIRRLI